MMKLSKQHVMEPTKYRFVYLCSLGVCKFEMDDMSLSSSQAQRDSFCFLLQNY